ncbi:hypothetical protein [Corynebacterium sp. A21]|uniref:hypothetical protein n=1 Tax=Corynebacterium sp. A21 TaxID=3457318 RepID=UPI003FD2A895
MNTSTLKVALSAADTAWNQFKKYRDEKALETYDRLSTAAESVGGIDGLRERGSELLDDSRREAGNVTKAARSRLEKALAEATEKGQELSSDARQARTAGQKKAGQVTKKARKQAEQRAATLKAKAAKAAGKKEKGGNKFLIFGLLTTLLAAAGGAAFWYLRKNKETPGTNPPEVKEYVLKTKPEATLVYSTETPEGEEPASGKLLSEEELLASLDDQLSKHRIDEDADEAEDVEEAAEEITEATAADDLPEKGEELQAEYDKKNAPQRDQGEK